LKFNVKFSYCLHIKKQEIESGGNEIEFGRDEIGFGRDEIGFCMAYKNTIVHDRCFCSHQEDVTFASFTFIPNCTFAFQFSVSKKLRHDPLIHKIFTE
jgi:hypothetical protein